MKRLFDLTTSVIGLIFLSPIMIILAIIIKKEDNGPVFYRGARVGKNEKIFRIFKFRTMVLNADKIGGPSTSDDDPRITPIGKFLRDNKLDELPQLMNVVAGDMSLVGPRPDVASELETYTKEERKIFKVRPGITDWASLTYHNEGEILKGSTDPHKAYLEKIRPGKIQLALKYVDENSFITDISIICQTVMTLVKTRT